MKILTSDAAGSTEPADEYEVHSITTAAPAHSEEMRTRMVRYVTAMGIRVVCIVLVFAVDGWLKVIPIIGAVFLPWVAVMIANAQDKAESFSDSLIETPPHASLPEGVERTPRADASQDGDLLEGELLEDDEGPGPGKDESRWTS